MLAGEFDSDISVPNVLGFYVAKVKAKESLTYPKMSGIFALATAGFKPGEYFPTKRLIICLFLSSELFQKIIPECLDGNLNNSGMWESVLITVDLGILYINQEIMIKTILRVFFSWESYSSINIPLHFKISLYPVKLIYVMV